MRARTSKVFDQLYRQLVTGVEAVGWQLQSQALPWNRCVHLIAAGQMDAALPSIWNSERATWAAFPYDASGKIDSQRRLLRVNYLIYVNRTSRLRWNGHEFQNLKYGVGAPVGFASYDKLRSLGVLSRHPYSPAEAFRMLALGRLDGFVSERSMAEYFLKTMEKPERITTLDLPLIQADWYLVMSHDFIEDHRDTADLIWYHSAETHFLKAATR